MNKYNKRESDHRFKEQLMVIREERGEGRGERGEGWG